MDNAQKILERIKSDQIKPAPRWQFSWKYRSFGLLYFMASLLGALAFSVILLVLQHTDFRLTEHMGHSGVELFLGLLPFIWLITIVVCLIVSMLSIRHSWKGYKFSWLNTVISYVIMSMALGTLFFLAGGAKHLEAAFDVYVVSYESIEERKIGIWNQPDAGRLAGEIIRIDSDVLQLRDFDGNIWSITYINANVAPMVIMDQGEKIKILGQRVQDLRFSAEDIRPWGGPYKQKNMR